MVSELNKIVGHATGVAENGLVWEICTSGVRSEVRCVSKDTHGSLPVVRASVG